MTRIKTFIERKNEESLQLKKKEEQIKNTLATAKNNPKFTKLINYSMTSLEKLISPDNSEKYINIRSIIKLDGIKILSNVASANVHNDELINEISGIMCKFLSYDDPKNNELSKYFVEKDGHMDIYQLLISIKNEKGIKSLLEVIYKLVQVPKLVNSLLNTGLVETLKFLNDNHGNSIQINDILYKIASKITNHRKGREMLLNSNLIPGGLSYLEKNLKSKNMECIFNGLMIFDNICKDEKGRELINSYKTFNDILIECFNDSQIIHKIIKIYSKIGTVKDALEKIEKIKNIFCSLKNNINEINEYMIDLKESLNYLSNFMIVEDIGKAVSSIENMKAIIDLFNLLYSIDLQNKDKTFLIDFLSLMKEFMIIFKRMIEYDAEYLEENNNKGKLFLPITNNVLECGKKNWEGIIPFFESEDKKEIVEIFKSFFSPYCEIFVSIYYKLFSDNLNNNEIISLLEYILEKFIFNAKEYLYKDEKLNYYFSLLLKIINDMIKKKIDNLDNLYNHLINCFDYFKEIITTNENYKTLSNFIDLIYNLIKSNKNSQINEDIIPIIINIMIKKPKFRYPNLINLRILDNYLTQEFIQKLHIKKNKKDIKNKENENDNNEELDNNPNYNLDYVFAICSVMVKGLYEISDQDKEKKNINENKYINDFKEEKNKEIEKKILIEGGKLLKKLISPEEFLEKVNLLKKLVKDYIPGKTNQDNIDIIEDNINFQVCALNMNEYLNKGMEDDFNCIKQLIIKEINYIENYKRENAKDKEVNPEYKEICKKSAKMIKLGLTALRKIEDGAIINYSKNNNEKYINLLGQIVTLNIEIIDKSTDSEIQINHLKQLRKNATFLHKNEKNIKIQGPGVIEQYISSLLSLFRKNINEELCFAIIETFIVLSNYNKEIYNLLVKGGYPKLSLQFLEATLNNQYAHESVVLLKSICLSKQENLIMLANQNILITFFEIRAKFINDKKITQCIDVIVNEIMKLPNQALHIDEILLDAIKDFHENMKHKFDDDKIKTKLLSDLIVINSYTTTKTQIKNLISNQEFINDFVKCVNQTLETKQSSQLIERMFICEIEIVKKLKDHIPETQQNLHQNFCNFLLKILFHPSTFSESFLLTANTLLYYIRDNEMYDKYLNEKIDEKFIEQLIDQEENYIDAPQISKAINSILSYLALKNPNFAKYIVRKGGLVNIIDDLKTLVNLNDENSVLIKSNGLIMIDALLNEEKNMEIFINSNGIALINSIIQNEILIKQKKENDFIMQEEYFKTICCINLDNTKKNIIKENTNNKKDSKDRRRSSNIIISDLLLRESSTRRASQILSLLGINENNLESNNIEDFDELDELDDDNNYIYYCIKIINKGLSKNKKEFINKDTVNNLVKIAEWDFPEKLIFSQLVEFLTFYIKKYKNKENDNNENDFIQNKNIIKFSLSNRAFFYSDENILKKAENIENEIASIIFEKNEYISEYKKVLTQKYTEFDKELKYKMITYLSLIIDLPLFKKVFDEIQNEIVSFFNDVLTIFHSSFKDINNNQNNNNPQDKKNLLPKKEGILLSLLKIYNYFVENKIMDKNHQNILETIDFFEKIGILSYSPNNYLFVKEFEKEIIKLIGQISGFIFEEKKDKKIIKYTKSYFTHLQNIFHKVICFVEDFCNIVKSPDFFDNRKINIIKEDNLENILGLVTEYYKTSEDSEKKEESSPVLFDTFMNMLEIFFGDEINEIYTKNGRLFNKLKLLWKLIYNALLNDNKKIVLEKISTPKISDLIEKLKLTIKIKQNNRPSLRKIPLLISRKIEMNSEVNKIIYDFVCEDLNNYGKNNKKIKKLDLEILSYLSKFYLIMKEILADKNLWKFLKDEYSKNNLPNDIRLCLAIIFRNATKNKANLGQLIKNDSNCLQIIFSKVLKDPITSLENNGNLIAETEMESVCNIIKNKANLNVVLQKNIVNNDELKTIVTIYDRLDSNICKTFKPILNEIALDDKMEKNLKTINEDEEKIKELEQIVLTNYEKHVLEFIKYFDRNKKEEMLLDSIVKDELMMEGKKRTKGENDINIENKNKEKIKTPLSIKTNNKMYPTLSEILLILIKNYNLLNSFKDDEFNIKRILIINKCFNLLQKISLSPDNHESILEDGLINLLEKMCDDYKKEKAKGVNKDDNNYLSNFISKGKFILKECSKSNSANIAILDSPIFENIVSEIMEFNENPKLLNSNSNAKKIFIYDTAIITNICMISKSYEQIINKLEINTILKLGTKTGNIILLENINDMIIYYLTVICKKSEIKLDSQFYDMVFAVMEKCIRNKNRSSLLMSKTLNLACILYNSQNSQKIDKLKLFESIYTDIEIFSTDEMYILSALHCLIILIKNNPQNIDECFEIGLVKKIKKLLYELTKDNLDKHTKILCQLTEFYYYLVKQNPKNSDKLCDYDVTRNVVKYIDIFNSKVQPKSEEEKEIEVQQNQLELFNNSIKNGEEKKEKDNINNENEFNDELLKTYTFKSNKLNYKKSPKNNYIRRIMMNCICYLDVITTVPDVNKYLSTNTSFNRYLMIAIQNENNDNNFLVISLHCFGNYLLSEASSTFLKTKLVEIYQLLKNLQTKYYSNSGILININYISGSIIMNLIDNNYVKMFFDLVAESIKCQEWNANLIKIALKIMNESLDKKPFIIDTVNDQLISSIINILENYKDNYEIQLSCYQILSYFATDDYNSVFSGKINELLRQIKQSLSTIFNDTKSDKIIKEKIKKAIDDLVKFLGNIEQYSENIISELIIPFNKELNDYGIDDETNGAFILNIFEHLFKNKIFIEPFVINKGIETLIKLLKSIDNNFHNENVILQLFTVLKRILIVNDEYKLMMQKLKMSDLINRVIKLTSNLDKKIEFEGKSLLFLISMAKAQLEEVVEVDFTDIKLVEPIKPEVKNYLTSGKQLKIINEHGEAKERQLAFTQDLLKVQAKLIKSNLPPKPKYIIETHNIKAIIKGHGTDYFKKSGGLFRSVPKPELCFSIIGPKTESGLTKSLNVVCRNENEVNRWINYMEKVILFFQKKKLLGNVEIIKEIKK